MLLNAVVFLGSSTDWLARYSEAPDDDLFRHLAHLYSNTHPTMHYGEPCEVFPGNFPGGIVNGAQWYVIRGERTSLDDILWTGPSGRWENKSSWYIMDRAQWEVREQV